VPGELADERVVARYTIEDLPAGATVSGRPGTYIDLAFPDGFEPQDRHDTFDGRLQSAIDTVAWLATAFTWFVCQAPGAKRLPSAADANPSAIWTAARRSPRRWTEDELNSLKASELGLGVVKEADHLSLIVSTPEGIFERVIPDASPLPQRITRGIAAETAIQDAAATWGLPDFVMRPRVERKGSGVREISDGLLVVGERGAVVQAKSRDVEPRDPARECHCLSKQIKLAIKEADGTVRQMAAKTTQMLNGRGRSISVNGNTISWVAVVIIEHPDSDYEITPIDSRIPAVVLLRRDSEFLFNQLRSTRAVVDYLHRVGEPVKVLGSEPERYYELAADDRHAAAAPPNPARPAYPGQTCRCRCSPPHPPAATMTKPTPWSGSCARTSPPAP
jgi:hypothetical protein